MPAVKAGSPYYKEFAGPSERHIESDDLYGDEAEDEAEELATVAAATAKLAPPSAEALKLLKEMSDLAQRHQDDADAKVLGFLSWVRENQCAAAGFDSDDQTSIC